MGAGSCGDDSSGDAGTTAAAEVVIPWGPSELYYVEQANKICRENTLQMRRRVAERYPNARRGRQFDEAAQNIFLPSLQLEFDNVSYLGAPVGDKPRIEEMLIALQLAVFRGQEQTIASARQMATIFSEFNRLASKYGLDSCLVDEATVEIR